MHTYTSASWLSGSYISDGGLETGLIYDHGVDLPEFAAFPLLDESSGRDVLRAYYDSYADIARRAETGLTLESPTWRANPDWGAKLGYDRAALARVNRTAIEFLHELRDSYSDIDDVRIIGAVGPRGDGYVAGERVDAAEAADYHRDQIEAFAAAGADTVGAYTLTESRRESASPERAVRPASRS